MKTPVRLLLCCSLLTGVCACTPPADEVHPKKRSARTDNLKRYVPKAQELRALEQARSKPVVNGALLEPSVLKEFLTPLPGDRISAAVAAQREVLQQAVREAFSKRAAQKAAALIAQFGAEASASAQTAQTPEEFSARLDALKKQYDASISRLGEEEVARGWSKANAEQSRLSRKDLQQVFRSTSVSLEKDYGPLCAQKAQPVLRKAADDYWLVLSSIKHQEDLSGEFARVGAEADAALAQVAAQYGDPALSFSAEVQASLKSRAISAHQEVEKQFEKLYGKDAVLQVRDVFEGYLNGLEKLFSAPGRLAAGMEYLEALNAAYREKITALQVQLNEDLEQKLLAARTVRKH